MVLQISTFTIFTDVSGMVLLPISFWITLSIIRLVSNKRAKIEWSAIAVFIVILLGGYILGTVIDSAGNSASITPLANLIYLIGSIFTIMVMLVSFHTAKEHKHTELALLQLNSDLESRVEEHLRSLEETRAKMLKQDKLQRLESWRELSATSCATPLVSSTIRSII